MAAGQFDEAMTWYSLAPGVASDDMVKAASLSSPLRNSIGIQLNLLPAGTFIMGDAGGDSDESPHTVMLTQPFFISICEVTNAQWKTVMGSAPSKWKDDDGPVEGVTWEEAMDFCHQLSCLPDEHRAGRVYRLPTEAEWEYACQAGSATDFSGGDGGGPLERYAWYAANSEMQPHPVGQRLPNAWGLFDMHGNVWEWCSDRYGPYEDGDLVDPINASNDPRRVIRGGSWRHSADCCRSAHRNAALPDCRSDCLGFRLVMITLDQVRRGQGRDVSTIESRE
jgi:formylglycine-generating enzyme required for sulfatase activity